VYRLLAHLLFAAISLAQCRLPDVATDALTRLTPAELVDGGHFLRAEQVLAPIVRSYPEDISAAWLLSRAKAELGELDEALTLAESALRADPSNPAYHVQVAAVAGRLAEKASLFRQLSFARRARQELDAALALDAAYVDAQWGLMLYYYAAPSLIGGDKTKAVQIGEQIASLSPGAGRYYQGRLAIQMNDPDRAEAYFRQSALENPLSFDTAAALADLYIEQKPNQARAEKWACQAVHADPLRATAWALLAKVHTMCGCWTEAVDIARRADAIDGENQIVWYTIASVAVARGEQLDMAAEFLRRYLSRPSEGGQPTEAQARLELGLALSKSGQPAEAISELRSALELDPGLEAAKAEIKRINAEARR